MISLSIGCSPEQAILATRPAFEYKQKHADRSHHLRSMKTSKRVVLALTVVGTALVAIWIQQSVATSLERAAQVKCKARLNHIGLAFREHGQTNGGVFPREFAMISWMGERSFVCPSSGNKPKPGEKIDAWSDFVLFPGRTRSIHRPTLLAHCRPEFHRNKGCGVLLTDGSVRFVVPSELSRLVSEATAAGPTVQAGP